MNIQNTCGHVFLHTQISLYFKYKLNIKESKVLSLTNVVYCYFKTCLCVWCVSFSFGTRCDLTVVCLYCELRSHFMKE